jgi:hypothetical protein
VAKNASWVDQISLANESESLTMAVKRTRGSVRRQARTGLILDILQGLTSKPQLLLSGTIWGHNTPPYATQYSDMPEWGLGESFRVAISAREVHAHKMNAHRIHACEILLGHGVIQ